jgi:hypothetical protein
MISHYYSSGGCVEGARQSGLVRRFRHVAFVARNESAGTSQTNTHYYHFALIQQRGAASSNDDRTNRHPYSPTPAAAAAAAATATI